MGEVRVRNLDADVVSALKALARRPRRDLVTELQSFHTQLRERYGELPDSTPLVREERDRWG